MQMVDETFSAELADVLFDMLVSCCAASAWYVRFWPQSKHIIAHVILSCNAFALARRVLRSMLGDVSGADSRMFFLRTRLAFFLLCFLSKDMPVVPALLWTSVLASHVW